MIEIEQLIEKPEAELTTEETQAKSKSLDTQSTDLEE